MKHYLTFTTILILGFGSLNAQDLHLKDNQKTNFGIIGGINLYNFSPAKNKSLNSSENTDFYGGLFVNYKLSNEFSLQLEALYLNGINNDNNDHIEIPLMLNYSINKKINIYTGAQLNYMFQNNFFLNELGYGYNLGLQYNFSKTWYTDLRYVHRTYHTKKQFTSDSDNIKGFRLGIGFRF
jgi:opacity protein-like surface antigen